jgi:hypothetical protein
MRAASEFRALSRSRELDVIGVPQERREEVLGLARGAFEAVSREAPSKAA